MVQRIACASLSMAFVLLLVRDAPALDPRKALTQYAQKVWTQEHGLPQDTIRAITQTTDGYLWLGTDEGLARFDGYDFVVFDKDHNNLPANSISSLAAGADGSLWIGTPSGLTRYRDRKFYTYTTKDGLPDDTIADLTVDHTGTLWAVSGVDLARFDGSRFQVFKAAKDVPVTTVQRVTEDRLHELWVGGFGGVVKRVDSRFVAVLDAPAIKSGNISRIVRDSVGNLWIGSSQGLVLRSVDGKIHKYDTRDGLPDIFVRALQVDRDGNVWVGTNSGLARLHNNRFVTMTGHGGQDRDQVRSLFEDREGNLWIGASNGLTRLRDDLFTVYGKSEGLPGDDPNTVYQDHGGRIWVGYHDSGLLLLAPDHYQLFTTRNGLPNNEVFSIRESRDGDLLLGTRGGFVRMHDKRHSTYIPPDELNRELVFDALEDSAGRLWLALPRGLGQLTGKRLTILVPGGQLLNDAVISLAEGRNGVLWAGTYGKGLWRVAGEDKVHYTEGNGLSSDEIRAVREDADGTLWIATFGGGLNAFRNNLFTHFTVKDGLLSDNISDIADDGDSLWLSTTRGICRISKKQLRDFDQHKIHQLEPTNYGVDDGLRSAQSAPGYPIPGGGRRTNDGRLWFPTSQGLAVIDPHAPVQTSSPPELHLVEMTSDGDAVDFSKIPQLPAGSQRIQIRYTAIHLGAPERIRYSHKLEGLDMDWVRAGNRRVINYNTLAHGKYLFRVRADLPGGPATEGTYAFEVLPHFYETAWFRLVSALVLVAVGWGLYQLRLRQLASRFALVLEERARMARELHDTLLQTFHGLMLRLQVVNELLPAGKAQEELEQTLDCADQAIIESRNAIHDLHSSAMMTNDLAHALQAVGEDLARGTSSAFRLVVEGPVRGLHPMVRDELYRIAREALRNAYRHAHAKHIEVEITYAERLFRLRIRDDGDGIPSKILEEGRSGHYGLPGMRERARQVGSELDIRSRMGNGTEIDLSVAGSIAYNRAGRSRWRFSHKAGRMSL